MSSAGPGRREVAHRLFAAEYDDATLEYAESDEERAPNYVVTPSGTRINRLFVVGVLTAVEQVNDDTVRARIADPTGAFVVYAGQYQPDELAALQSLEAPAFVAVTGKANTFSPEGSDRVLTSVRPESVTEVDAETRDRWVTTTAEHTLARIQTAASALSKDERGESLRAALLRDGVDPSLAEGVARAIDHYDTTADYLGALRDLAVQALEVVAGERSEVESMDHEPAGGEGTVTASDLAALLGEERLAATRAADNVDVDALLGDVDDAAPGASESDAADSAEESADAESTTPDSESDPTGNSVSDPDTEPESTGAADSEDGKVSEETGGAEAETDEAAVEDTAAETEEPADAPDDPRPADSDDDGDDATADADPETSETAAETADAEQAGNDEIYEFDEEEREQIEAEHGVEFQSGTEVEPAGEADIETDAEEGSDAEAETGATDDGADDTDEADTVDEAETDDESATEETESTDASDDDAEGDVDLEAALVEEMDALDDGDGADREALIDAVAGETGADAEAIDDAIDDLLMSGQCYEPSEGTLKPI
ncbi:hypothetical protein [Salinarchaeum laminariae]|uniref:hypothetical protein n=1 Tax=Salinarchaeum laminariae TaxID=869888 RepID=UPI0020BD9F3C|nr:hypothetical protein [Salinarchaeum laminariae]